MHQMKIVPHGLTVLDQGSFQTIPAKLTHSLSGLHRCCCCCCCCCCCNAVSIANLSCHEVSLFHQIASSAGVCNAHTLQLEGSKLHFLELRMSKTLHQGSHQGLHFLTRHSHCCCCHGFAVMMMVMMKMKRNLKWVEESQGKRVTELCLMACTLFCIPVSCSSAHGLQTVIVAHSVSHTKNCSVQ